MIDGPTMLETVHAYLRTKHVVFGRDRMEDLIRRHEAGLVWLSEDYSRHASKTAIKLCTKKEVPCMQVCTVADFEEVTHIENIRILTLRKSFPGLKRILEELSEADLLYY